MIFFLLILELEICIIVPWTHTYVSFQLQFIVVGAQIGWIRRKVHAELQKTTRYYDTMLHDLSSWLCFMSRICDIQIQIGVEIIRIIL
jgi:hypothetical protein